MTAVAMIIRSLFRRIGNRVIAVYVATIAKPYATRLIKFYFYKTSLLLNVRKIAVGHTTDNLAFRRALTGSLGRGFLILFVRWRGPHMYINNIIWVPNECLAVCLRALGHYNVLTGCCTCTC